MVIKQAFVWRRRLVCRDEHPKEGRVWCNFGGFSQLSWLLSRTLKSFRLSAAEYTGCLLVWLFTFGRPSCWLTSAFRLCTSQRAGQPSWPASSVDKLISDLCCNWQGRRLFQCFGCPLPAWNSWGISYRGSEAELVLFIDGARRAVNAMHQIRLMGEKSEVCSGEEKGDVFGRGEWLSKSVCMWHVCCCDWECE